MSTNSHQSFDQIQISPRRWLVTGCAGFIGSNLILKLLQSGQTVVGLDNFSTGFQHNLDEIRALAGEDAWSRFSFIEGDIVNLETCLQATQSIDVVLHQAALGSVPRSLADPISTNNANSSGFLNMLVAARDNKVDRFVYAASSSTYGDHQAQPRQEDVIGNPLSPYAVTKLVNELYAGVFARSYSMELVGLRYFNVFGPRQTPDGAYAAVIPRWIRQMLQNEKIVINGDGHTTRDFCFIDNVVQANILAAIHPRACEHDVYNVALNQQTSLNELFELLKAGVQRCCPDTQFSDPVYADFRKGDVQHSRADIKRAQEVLGYSPQFTLSEGLADCMPWYVNSLIESHPNYQSVAR